MIQKPFTFSQKKKLKSREDVRKITPFSKNIRGICITCGHRVQKVKFEKDKQSQVDGTIETVLSENYASCTRCHQQGLIGKVVKFPKEAIPWEVKKTINHAPFYCSHCRRRFFNFAVLSALCSHKKHQAPIANYCRFCCTGKSKNNENELELEPTQVQVTNTRVVYADLTRVGARLEPQQVISNWATLLNTSHYVPQTRMVEPEPPSVPTIYTPEDFYIEEDYDAPF